MYSDDKLMQNILFFYTKYKMKFRVRFVRRYNRFPRGLSNQQETAEAADVVDWCNKYI